MVVMYMLGDMALHIHITKHTRTHLHIHIRLHIKQVTVVGMYMSGDAALHIHITKHTRDTQHCTFTRQNTHAIRVHTHTQRTGDSSGHVYVG